MPFLGNCRNQNGRVYVDGRSTSSLSWACREGRSGQARAASKHPKPEDAFAPDFILKFFESVAPVKGGDSEA
jgi:hypothetical protein